LAGNPNVPQVRISSFEVNGKTRGGAGVAPPTALELAHSDTALTLSFAAMDFHQPTRNRFRYRLDDQPWVESQNNTVNLARLGAGQYRFEVMGSNNEGVWSREPARLDLTVRAPWWETRGAYAGYALALLLLAYGYDRSQRRKLAREREFSEELADAHSLAEANHQLALRNAQYDNLTQLPNRASLLEALARYMRFARGQGGELALLLINLDRFQRINDNLGHKLGDNVLKVTAERLQSVVERDDLLARVGSDEFALIAMRPAGVDLDAWLAELAARLQAAVAANHDQLDPALNLSAAIGIAHHDAAIDAEDSATDLLGCANVALHAAKRDGTGRVRRYQPGMIESARERLAIEGRMHRALEAEEFVPFYQPLIDVRHRTLAGFEALIRWQPPGQAMIFPDQFIPVAEESGLIVEIGNLMIRQACRQLAAWQRWDIAIAVNVSMRQLRSGTLVATIDRALHETGVPAHCLKLEITESAMLEHVEDTAAQLRAIKQLGVRLSVDDFGTGFSSLSHLKMLPVDELKIDRSFVADLVGNKHSQKIVSSIIRLAHELQLSVVAEGVEEESALAHLRGLGCDLAQGYLFDRPRPPAQLEERGWLGAQLPIATPASA
jgi:diguanylate cyclase (GGDEF)-like protein